jgi:hypothetical protein
LVFINFPFALFLYTGNPFVDEFLHLYISSNNSAFVQYCLSCCSNSFDKIFKSSSLIPFSSIFCFCYFFIFMIFNIIYIILNIYKNKKFFCIFW